MANYANYSESQYNNASAAAVRIKKGTNKLPLKNCIKIIQAMTQKDAAGKKGKVGSLCLADALRAAGYSGFSTSLLTFMDAERTKMIAFYAAPNEKKESALASLVEQAYALVDDTALGNAVTKAHEHLEDEKKKEEDKAAKRAAAREEEISLLKAHFVGSGMTVDEAAELAAKCRIINADMKEERPRWAINDLFASFAFTKAEALAKWEEELAAVEKEEKKKKDAAKKEREAKRAKREDEKKKVEAELERVKAQLLAERARFAEQLEAERARIAATCPSLLTA